jgi:hypothetical protein
MRVTEISFTPLLWVKKAVYLKTHKREKSMKIISQFLLLVVTVATITACGDMGKGPSKPASSNSEEILLK